jgi:tetratricopeptide (TPR) repeat protein
MTTMAVRERRPTNNSAQKARLKESGRVLLLRGDVQLSAGLYCDAASLFARALDRYERSFGPSHPALTAPLNRLAIALRHLARFTEAGALHQRALALLHDSDRATSHEAADTFSQLGGLEHAAGNWLRGEQFAREALRIRTRVAGPHHPDVAADLVSLAALLDQQGKLSEAERLYRRALPLLEEAHSTGHHLVAVALNNLAAVRAARGRLDEAEALYRRARAVEIDRSGRNHPAVAFSTNNLAVLLSKTRRERESAALFRRAIALLARHHGNDHPSVGACLENLAYVLRRLGDHKGAKLAAARAARLSARIDAVNDAGVAVTGTINPRYTCYRLTVRTSSIHRMGVFAEEAIPRGRKVIEYTGERISQREAERRWNPRRSYLFELDERWQLDGAIGGSGAEYINHSCAPNLRTRILQGHILYFSDQPIAKGEELTVDYHYEADLDPMPCGCGAPTCRGTMNVKE